MARGLAVDHEVRRRRVVGRAHVRRGEALQALLVVYVENEGDEARAGPRPLDQSPDPGLGWRAPPTADRTVGLARADEWSDVRLHNAVLAHDQRHVAARYQPRFWVPGCVRRRRCGRIGGEALGLAWGRFHGASHRSFPVSAPRSVESWAGLLDRALFDPGRTLPRGRTPVYTAGMARSLLDERDRGRLPYGGGAGPLLCTGRSGTGLQDRSGRGILIGAKGVPRARGDGPTNRGWAALLPEGSPRARGWTHNARGRRWHPRGFPARAGMDPAILGVVLDIDRVPDRVPRARGDGP